MPPRAARSAPNIEERSPAARGNIIFGYVERARGPAARGLPATGRVDEGGAGPVTRATCIMAIMRGAERATRAGGRSGTRREVPAVKSGESDVGGNVSARSDVRARRDGEREDARRCQDEARVI
jgi:hypothetical protein